MICFKSVTRNVIDKAWTLLEEYKLETLLNTSFIEFDNYLSCFDNALLSIYLMPCCVLCFSNILHAANDIFSNHSTSN